MKKAILALSLILCSTLSANACPPWSDLLEERENVTNLLGPVDNRGCRIVIHFDKTGKEVSRRFSNTDLHSVDGKEIKLVDKSIVQTKGTLYPIYGVVDKLGEFIVEAKYHGIYLNENGSIDAILINGDCLQERELLLISYLVNLKYKTSDPNKAETPVPESIDEAVSILNRMFTDKFKDKFKQTAEKDLAINLESICPFFIDIWNLKSNENSQLIDDGKAHKLKESKDIVIFCFDKLWAQLQAPKQISKAETKCDH